MDIKKELEEVRALLNESLYEEDSIIPVIERWKEQAVAYESIIIHMADVLSGASEIIERTSKTCWSIGFWHKARQIIKEATEIVKAVKK